MRVKKDSPNQFAGSPGGFPNILYTAGGGLGSKGQDCLRINVFDSRAPMLKKSRVCCWN